jgi:hypothetical protein
MGIRSHHLAIKREGDVKITLGIKMVISFGLFVASCNVRQTEPPVDQAGEDANSAQQSLVGFLEDLQTGRYDEAAKLYGGNYEIMIDHNPNLDPNDHTGLLRNACTINGTACLELKSIALVGEESANAFNFKVEFMDEDGSLFVLGPCCGGNETDTPSQSVFTFTVIKNNDGNFVVMEMPPYVP